MCQDYQQQGRWSDERVEIGTINNPIIQDGVVRYTSSEYCQGICVWDEEASTVGLCSFVETILGCVSVKSDIP